MKNNILGILVIALSLFFSACNEEFSDDALAVESEDAIEYGANIVALSDNINSGDYIVSYDGLAQVVIENEFHYVTQFVLTSKDDGTELRAFCANINYPCYDGATYQSVDFGDYFQNGEEQKIMAALTYIENNYADLETTNWEGYLQLVQCIIWRIIHDYEDFSVNNIDAKIIQEVIDYIYNDIDNITNDYNTGVTMEGAGIAVENDGFVNYGPFNVSLNALLSDVVFDLAFDNEETSAIFVDETGEEITQTVIGAPFFVQINNDVFGEFNFTATASLTESFVVVNDFILFNDIRNNENNRYQPLFHPIKSSEVETYFYSCSSGFTLEAPEEPEPEPEPEPDADIITVSNLSWNNGNISDKDGANGAGINSFTADGITFKNNRNYLTPANFDANIAKTPDKNDKTEIYTVTERTVTMSGQYVKVYDVKIAFYKDGEWKVYGGTISVNNPGGNDNVQKFEFERIF